MGGAEGQAVDIDIAARQILKVKDRLNQILAKHTGKDIKKLEKDTDRDFFMSAVEAKTYGVVDKIINRLKPTPWDDYNNYQYDSQKDVATHRFQYFNISLTPLST